MCAMFSVTYISTKLEIKKKYNNRRWSTMLSPPQSDFTAAEVGLGYEDGLWSWTVRTGYEAGYEDGM